RRRVPKIQPEILDPRRAWICVPLSLVPFHFAIALLARWSSVGDELPHFARKSFENNGPQQSTNLGVRSSNLFGPATKSITYASMRFERKVRVRSVSAIAMEVGSRFTLISNALRLWRRLARANTLAVKKHARVRASGHDQHISIGRSSTSKGSRATTERAAQPSLM